MKKRLASIAITFCMLATMLPTGASATTNTNKPNADSIKYAFSKLSSKSDPRRLPGYTYYAIGNVGPNKQTQYYYGANADSSYVRSPFMSAETGNTGIEKTFYTDSKGRLCLVESGSMIKPGESSTLYSNIRAYTLDSSYQIIDTKIIHDKPHEDCSTQDCTSSKNMHRVSGFYQAPDKKLYVTCAARHNGKVIVWLHQYDADWNPLKTVAIDDSYGNSQGITAPYNQMNTEMAQVGSQLFIRFGKQTAPDKAGVLHQMADQLVVDLNTMSPVKIHPSVQNNLWSAHNFRSELRSNNGELLILDHGDSTPRGFRLLAIPNLASNSTKDIKSYTIQSFTGRSGENVTGAIFSDLDAGKNGYIVVGQSAPHNNAINGITGMSYKKDGDTYETMYLYNNFIAFVNATTGKVTYKWLTTFNPKTTTDVNISEPKLIKVSDDEFIVMYSVSSPSDTYTRYTLYNSAGRVLFTKEIKDLMVAYSNESYTYNNELVWVSRGLSYGNPYNIYNNYTAFNSYLQSNPQDYYLFRMDISNPKDPKMITAKTTNSNVVLTSAPMNMVVGKSTTAKARVEPIDLQDQLVWSSSNPTIATIDASSGLVTALSAGTVTISVSLKANPSQSRTFTLRVVSNGNDRYDGPSSLSIGNNMAMRKGDTVKLTPVFSPAGTKGNVTYTSSNTSVATVSASGQVTAKGNGKAKITAKVGSVSASIEVTVTEITATGITFNNPAPEVSLGNTISLQATILPAGAGGRITYSSDDSRIATVNSVGVVTPKKEGTVRIYATVGKYKTYCRVKVTPLVLSELKLNYTSQTLELGKYLTIKPTNLPSGTSPTVTYASSDSKVATVSSSGFVTPVKAGTAIITVKAGGASATCTITVTGTVARKGPDDGWYNFSVLKNYLNITANGSAELRNLTQKAAFEVTMQADGNYTIKTKSGKYLGVTGTIKDGIQLQEVSSPYLWKFYSEGAKDTFSFRPASNLKMAANASGVSNKNGTKVTLWTYTNTNAPSHAEFKLIAVDSKK